ncbi:hypothetical protein DCS_04241 [Drechmeria coniospora]|uniref:Secreted protein n=1 Tax=Drechmeria coniospora TaxID=98403 RepID=A0A151GJF5_DRECN|nr:hypothetical protein DCS_04241 [Drechmeria coniospora]KYK57234.1 hypothetical protein DCS_04241 [Drechmeria coniospora]
MANHSFALRLASFLFWCFLFNLGHATAAEAGVSLASDVAGGLLHHDTRSDKNKVLVARVPPEIITIDSDSDGDDVLPSSGRDGVVDNNHIDTRPGGPPRNIGNHGTISTEHVVSINDIEEVTSHIRPGRLTKLFRMKYAEGVKRKLTDATFEAARMKKVSQIVVLDGNAEMVEDIGRYQAPPGAGDRKFKLVAPHAGETPINFRTRVLIGIGQDATGKAPTGVWFVQGEGNDLVGEFVGYVQACERGHATRESGERGRSRKVDAVVRENRIEPGTARRVVLFETGQRAGKGSYGLSGPSSQGSRNNPITLPEQADGTASNNRLQSANQGQHGAANGGADQSSSRGNSNRPLVRPGQADGTESSNRIPGASDAEVDQKIRNLLSAAGGVAAADAASDAADIRHEPIEVTWNHVKQVRDDIRLGGTHTEVHRITPSKNHGQLIYTQAMIQKLAD